ncbi:SgcJ/EcaC family oxidoreductase [Pseudonocardia sp. DLS-67]
MPTSVEDTLTSLAAAWNDGDATSYAELFTPDATYVIFDGTVVRGRTAIEEGHRALFAGPLRGFRMEPPTATPVRYLGADVAHVVAAGGTRPPGQEGVPSDRASVVSFVLVREGEDWKIAAFQNTRASR